MLARAVNPVRKGLGVMLKRTSSGRTVVIGAGIGGLAAALRLAHAGQDVVVLERAAEPGGKLRTMDTVAGPVDAGPTVFTMRPLFEQLFADVGERLDDHLNTVAETVLARHWWPDGSQLDLHADHGRSVEAIRDFAGDRSAREFERFCADARRLFEAFDGPIMRSANPSLATVTGVVMSNPRLMMQMTPPRTLWRTLERRFSDPRLVQLFARYATYVGGSPFASPAILGLIWHAEASGVWQIEGGMHQLAKVLERLAIKRGARFEYGAHVSRIEPHGDQPLRVHLATGDEIVADSVVFNGDPAALAQGKLGSKVARNTPAAGVSPRALSAYVWSFAAEPEGVGLAHHNIFFNHHYRREFTAIDAGRMPEDATLYVCAQDRGAGRQPTGPERFEIIMNGPARSDARPDDPEEKEICRLLTFRTLARAGLRFSPPPGPESLTTPAGFAALFPGSDGSLYGRSPHGMMASFQRPTVRTRIPGLYLAGGGVHPGPGLPMAMSSGRHAAEAILTDLASTSPSRLTATRGGTLTGSLTTGSAASRSLPS